MGIKKFENKGQRSILVKLEWCWSLSLKVVVVIGHRWWFVWCLTLLVDGWRVL